MAKSLPGHNREFGEGTNESMAVLTFPKDGKWRCRR